jgi:integrase
MKIQTHGSKVYLETDSEILHVPGTLYLNETYANHHTKQVVAKALRVWIRLADAFGIDLAARALEGRWLTEVEKKALRHLVFRPIEEIESMSDRAVQTIASAIKDKEPNLRSGAVEPNTALKQLVGIADFLRWFHTKILQPRMPIRSAVSETLRQQVEVCAREIKKGVRGTKSLHPHNIRSVPTERFLQIYSAVYLRASDLLRTDAGKIGSNVLRDRAMILLASEGLRPGAVGNVALADFKWARTKAPAYVVIKDNTARRTKELSTSTPVQKGAASSQNYNSEFTMTIWPTTAQAIQDYIDSERVAVTTRGLRNRSEGFLFLADHGGPIGDRGTITHVFRRAGRGLANMGLLSKAPGDPYLDGEAYHFHAYVLRHSSASLFYATKSQTLNADVVTDLMKMRFGWTRGSAMPTLYAQRAISNAASLTVDDYMESLLAEAEIAKSAGEKK